MGETWREMAYYLGLLTYLGFVVTVSIFIGYWLGARVDQFLGTDMLFTIGGLLLGAIAGLIQLYRISVARFNKSE